MPSLRQRLPQFLKVESNMLNSLIDLALLVLVMLFAVPALTGGAVAVPSGGFLRAFMAIVAIVLTNILLWFLISMASFGGAIIADFLTFGLVALVVNGAAFWLTAKFAPNVLFVRNFPSALGAALITTIASYGIHYFFP
jgi:uncharacterized membrane protein YvlD (DUF360 family)